MSGDVVQVVISIDFRPGVGELDALRGRLEAFHPDVVEAQRFQQVGRRLLLIHCLPLQLFWQFL